MEAGVPPLQELCFRTVVQFLNFLGDVGDLHERALGRILSHCNQEQLRRIERCSKGRDLTPLLDPIWRGLFVARFGEATAADTLDWMKRGRLLYPWRKLFDAKEAAQKVQAEAAVKKIAEKFKRIEEEAPKMHVKILPSANTGHTLGKRKRSFVGGGGQSSTGSTALHRARFQVSTSAQARNVSDARTKAPAPPPGIRQRTVGRPSGPSREGNASIAPRTSGNSLQRLQLRTPTAKPHEQLGRATAGAASLRQLRPSS